MSQLSVIQGDSSWNVRYSRLSSTIDDYNFIHKLFTLRLIALDYPNQLITNNSIPWLTRDAHLRRNTNKKQNKPTRQSTTREARWNDLKRNYLKAHYCTPDRWVPGTVLYFILPRPNWLGLSKLLQRVFCRFIQWSGKLGIKELTFNLLPKEMGIGPIFVLMMALRLLWNLGMMFISWLFIQILI